MIETKLEDDGGGLRQVESLTFEVPGVPVAKGRARITTVGGHARAFTPAKTRTFEALVRDHADRAMRELGLPVLEGACRLVVRAYFPRRKREPTEFEQPMSVRPDADNVLKAVADALNGAVYRDDGQAVEEQVFKRRHAAGGTPRTRVTVASLEGEWIKWRR